MNPFLIPLLVAILAPLLATRSGPYVRVLPFVVAAPPILAMLVRAYAELQGESREGVSLAPTGISALDLSFATVVIAMVAVAFQHIPRHFGDHNAATRLTALQLGMATLWYGSGLEILPISGALGPYGNLGFGFVLVIIVPEILTRLLRPTEPNQATGASRSQARNAEQP